MPVVLSLLAARFGRRHSLAKRSEMFSAQLGEQDPLVRTEGLPRKLKAIKPGEKRVKQSWRRNLTKAGAFAMPEMEHRGKVCDSQVVAGKTDVVFSVGKGSRLRSKAGKREIQEAAPFIAAARRETNASGGGKPIRLAIDSDQA